MLVSALAIIHSAPITVFQSGEGFHTYRIPSIFHTTKGTTLALVEGRASQADAANNSIVLRISTDEGRSWGKESVIAKPDGGSYNNPCIVETSKGELILHYQHYPAGTHEFDVPTGWSGDKAVQAYQIKSRDQGKTWSPAARLTEQIKSPQAHTLASGPGVGIKLERGKKRGRLLMPYNQRIGQRFTVYAAISDDNGNSWRMGQTAISASDVHANEVQFVELAEGTILLNARNQASAKMRCVALSHDSGETWTPISLDGNLPDPTCQGAILRSAWPQKQVPGLIAFSNPADQTGRKNGVIRFSFDEGRTWPYSQIIESGSFQYSSLCRFADDRLGILYERVADNKYQIIFRQIQIEGVDRLTELRP